MKSLMGLLCLIFAIFSNKVSASEDFILNTNVSATQCKIINGIDFCTIMYDPQPRNVVIPLSQCDSDGVWVEPCSGTWEGTRNLGGQNFMIQISVRKYTYPGLNNSHSTTQYQLRASIKVEGARWRHLRVLTGNRPSLTDSAQVDGEEYSLSPDSTVTPGLMIGPAI